MDRTPQLGVCEQLKPTLSTQLLQKHPKTLFLKVLNFDDFSPDYPSLKQLSKRGLNGRRGRFLGFLKMRLSRGVLSPALFGGLFGRGFTFTRGFYG